MRGRKTKRTHISSKKSKYKNIRQTYNGYSYASKLEANYAWELDQLKKAGEIRDWRRQEKIEMRVNGYHVCDYKIDFVIEHKDGSEEFVEVKGFRTKVWALKWKLFEALYPDVKKRIVT